MAGHFDPSDEEYREQLAKAAYYRERAEEAALDRETNLDDDDTEYFCMAWEDVSDFSKRPYRTAVAEVCDRVIACQAA